MHYDDIIVAKGYKYSSDTRSTGLNNNQIIVGGSGSGKTMSITEPCLLHTNNRNLIVTVTKRRIVDKYSALLRSKGYKVDVLDFTDVNNSTIGFDPFRFAKTDEDILCMARNFVLANPNKKKAAAVDPYWDDAAISLFYALCLWEKLENPVEPCFANVIDKYRNLKISYGGATIQTNYDASFKRLELKFPNNPASANWEGFCHLASRTASCVMNVLHAAISYLLNGNLLNLMRKKEQLDFNEFSKRKSVLFVITSPVNLALSNLISVFYSTAMKQLFEFAEHQPNGKLPIPTHISCDDFATGAPIPDFPQYISIIREKELSVSILCQSESQLESIYSPSEAITIINNCDTYIFTGGMDIKTASSVAQRLNKPVDEVFSLPIGKFVVFRRGNPSVIVPRYPILEDPEHQRLFEEDIVA